MTKSGCLYESLDHVFFKVSWCTIQHVPEADTLNLVFAIVHGWLENYGGKGIRNIWTHIPQDLQRIRDLLLQRKTSEGIVNPEAKIHVRIVCQKGPCCAQLVWHWVTVHINSTPIILILSWPLHLIHSGGEHRPLVIGQCRPRNISLTINVSWKFRKGFWTLEQ